MENLTKVENLKRQYETKLDEKTQDFELAERDFKNEKLKLKVKGCIKYLLSFGIAIFSPVVGIIALIVSFLDFVEKDMKLEDQFNETVSDFEQDISLLELESNILNCVSEIETEKQKNEVQNTKYNQVNEILEEKPNLEKIATMLNLYEATLNHPYVREENLRQEYQNLSDQEIKSVVDVARLDLRKLK